MTVGQPVLWWMFYCKNVYEDISASFMVDVLFLTFYEDSHSFT